MCLSTLNKSVVKFAEAGLHLDVILPFDLDVEKNLSKRPSLINMQIMEGLSCDIFQLYMESSIENGRNRISRAFSLLT